MKFSAAGQSAIVEGVLLSRMFPYPICVVAWFNSYKVLMCPELVLRMCVPKTIKYLLNNDFS